MAVLAESEILDQRARNGGYMSWQHYVDSCVNLIREEGRYHNDFLVIHAEYDALSELVESEDGIIDNGVNSILDEDLEFNEWARWMLADRSRTYLELLVSRKLKEDVIKYDTVEFSPNNAIYFANKAMREIVNEDMVYRAVKAGMDKGKIKDAMAEARDESFEQSGLIDSTEHEKRRQRRDETRKSRETAVVKEVEDP